MKNSILNQNKMNNTADSPYDVTMTFKMLSNRCKPPISTILATDLCLGIIQKSIDNKNEILEKNNMK